MGILQQIVFSFFLSNVCSSCPNGPKNGELESETNQNGYYLNNEHRIWNKCTFNGYYFIITFDHFHLTRRWNSKCDDFLKITDQSNNKVLFNRCGDQIDPKVRSDSNNITIEFKTDNFQSNKTGFKLRWQSMIADTMDLDRANGKRLSTIELPQRVSTRHPVGSNQSYIKTNGTIAISSFTDIQTLKVQNKFDYKNRSYLSSSQNPPNVSTESYIKRTQTTYLSLSTIKPLYHASSLASSQQGLEKYLTSLSAPKNENPTQDVKSSPIKDTSYLSHVQVRTTSIYNIEDNTSRNTKEIDDSVENGTSTRPYSDDGSQSPTSYVIGIALGGILLEAIIVSIACTFFNGRKTKRWSVKTLSRIKGPPEVPSTWWKRPQSVTLSYNDRLSMGNLYHEINVHEMISFQNDTETIKNTEINRCPYEEPIRSDGEYDHIGKHREKRRSILDKINVYGFQRISSVFKNN